MKKKSPVNAKDSSDYEYGALIKLIDENRNWGVADLKPWPSLGDLTLQKEIETEGPLFQRSLFLAQEDLDARKNKISLLKNKPVENNWLVTNFNNTDNLKNLSGTIKIKCNQQTDQLLSFLDQLDLNDVKLRLDFNGSLDQVEFDRFLHSLPKQILQKIEYIEDPTSELITEWLQWNKLIPLAVDFAQGDILQNEKLWSYLIIKPARQDAKSLQSFCQQNRKKYTLTSSMDHPVGFAHGLRLAQEMAENKSGFLTLDVYEENDFSTYLSVCGNKVNFTDLALNDFGIGMTKALEKLKWAPL